MAEPSPAGLGDPARPTATANPGQPVRPTATANPGQSASRLVQPRLVVALVLIAVGIVWAVIRGLHFYGLAPIDIAYDLDQPPVLLALVGGWLCHRSRGG
jgi:hypothetical protein